MWPVWCSGVSVQASRSHPGHLYLLFLLLHPTDSAGQVRLGFGWVWLGRVWWGCSWWNHIWIIIKNSYKFFMNMQSFSIRNFRPVTCNAWLRLIFVQVCIYLVCLVLIFPQIHLHSTSHIQTDFHQTGIIYLIISTKQVTFTYYAPPTRPEGPWCCQ